MDRQVGYSIYHRVLKFVIIYNVGQNLLFSHHLYEALQVIAYMVYDGYSGLIEESYIFNLPLTHRDRILQKVKSELSHTNHHTSHNGGDLSFLKNY